MNNNIINLDGSICDIEKFLGITAYHGSFSTSQFPLVKENIDLKNLSDTVSFITIAKDFQIQLDTDVANRRIQLYGSTICYANMLVSIYLLNQLHKANLDVIPKPAKVTKTSRSDSKTDVRCRDTYTEMVKLQERIGIKDFVGSIVPEDLRKFPFKDKIRHLENGDVEYEIIKDFKVIVEKGYFRSFDSVSITGQYMRTLCDIYFLKNCIIKSRDLVKFTEDKIEKFLSSNNF